MTDEQRRYAGITRGTATAVAVRVVSAGVGFVSLPLALGYLGPERYGAWVTIVAVLGWLQIADLGVANGLTNALAEALGRGRPDAASAHVATSFWTLAGIAGALGSIFAVAWHLVPWASVFNVSSRTASDEIPAAVGLAFLLFVCGFPLAVLDRVYAAHQEGAIANAWSAAGSLTSLVALFCVTRSEGGLVALVAAVQGAQLLVNALNGWWLFQRHMPHLAPRWSRVRRVSVDRIVRDGWRFFVIQVAALLIFSTDNLIIARVLGAASVTPYAVAWRLFSLITVVVSLPFPYLWPAYAEAYARGDAGWIRRTLRISLLASVATAAIIGVPLVVFGPAIIRAWAGEAALPPVTLLAWMCAWALIASPAHALGCMLNGVGQLTGQMFYGSIAAGANVILSIQLAREYGIVGVTAATAIAFGVFAAAPAALETVFVLRRLRRQSAPVACS